MFEAIQTALQSNQLFAGGIVLGAFGMAGAFAGRLGQGLLQGLTVRLFPSITLDHRSPLYGYVQAWLQDHPYTRSCRSLTVMRRESPENGEVRLVPGDGSGCSGAVRQGAPIDPVKTEKRCRSMSWLCSVRH